MKPDIDYNQLVGTHDLRLSAWGPYTKKYMGLSHIPSAKAGKRFDVSVFPGLYRRKVQLPNVFFESDYHPWEAAADLSYFCHRHDLVWKDHVYCDVAFCRLSEEACLVEAKFVNNTDTPNNVALHYMASISFPPTQAGDTEPRRPAKLVLPKGGKWIDGLDHCGYDRGRPDPRANLTRDGARSGETCVNGFVDAQGVELDKGCRVSYKFNAPKNVGRAKLVLRYFNINAKSLKISGSIHRSLKPKKGDKIVVSSIDLGEPSGQCLLNIEADGRIQIDGFAVIPSGCRRELKFVQEELDYEPAIEHVSENAILLNYDAMPKSYGIAWHADFSETREFVCGDLDVLFKQMANTHVRKRIEGNGQEHYTNIFVRPVFLKPNSETKLYGLICTGSKTRVRDLLNEFKPNSPKTAGAFTKARKSVPLAKGNPSGANLEFSQNLMRALTLTNMVYPVRTRGTWIRHSTPGRWWDSLYTWDSGFIGLGLAEIDVERSIDNLNAYVTEPECSEAAFIFHGSMVPVQFYQFLELWNKTQSLQMLEFFYPRLKHYYLFYVGRGGSSTTASMKSGLLQNWDYFYNAGGWDDYPPQVYIHARDGERSFAPVVTTAHGIRIAKIMTLAAEALNLDTSEYKQDIDRLTEALQRHSWDEGSGYFGYVRHDNQGRPIDILREPGGANFNMGLGGASPLVAGICNDKQERRLVDALMDPERMWSRCGLSTVDQSAPYYSDDGYWNGAVWMPHQWFMWKALLSLGRTGEAHRIAATALEIWRAEAEESYNCHEHFIVKTGRGAGWHHFSGLSAPVLCWFNAYHKPGTLTVGLDTVVERLKTAAGGSSIEATLRTADCCAPAVIAVLTPGKHSATWNSKPIPMKKRYDGCYELQLSAGDASGKLKIQKKH